MILAVKVKPNARNDAVVAWEDDGTVVVAVAAPPTEGRANEALLKFLGKRLGVAPSRLSVKRGASSRVKHVELPEGTSLEGLKDRA